MIRCEMLTAGYGGRDVLHAVDWEAAEGRLTVIAGPNGSGKSTLLKALTGNAAVKEGCVYLDGKPFGQWKSREMAKKLAWLPQSRGDTDISVFRMALHGRFPYLSYPGRYTRRDEEMAVRALERMGVGGLMEKPVSELSGGEKQRAYLAMALVQDTPVLLLDEPATYLDLAAQMELMEILRQLTKEGKTIAVVLHDLNYALKYGEEIVLMQDGRIRQCGTPEEIIRSGIVEEVFHAHVHVLRDERGEEHYCFSPAKHPHDTVCTAETACLEVRGK